MPSLLSPNSSTNKAYAPLADEVNPPFGNIAPAPIVTRNGTIVYAKRTSSASSSHSSDDGLPRLDTYHQTASEETLSASGDRKGKGRATNEALPPHMVEGEADLGEMRRGGGTVRAKGKERAWDEEMGDRIEVVGPEYGKNGAYPPLNQVEEEERKIQDHLALLAARDMARRRAARVSRQMSNPPGPLSPTSSSITSSFMRRPLSMMSSMSSSDGKRNSIMGLMGGILGSPRTKDGRWAEGELPMANSPQDGRPNGMTYNNPYEYTAGPTPLPKMVASPTSPSYPSPFADPNTKSLVKNSNEFGARRTSLGSNSSATSPPLSSPTDGEGFSYGYAGASWRGGAAATPLRPEQADEGRGGEKWWHALCAWGSDLDGGHDAVDDGTQGGRTNPFE